MSKMSLAGALAAGTACVVTALTAGCGGGTAPAEKDRLAWFREARFGLFIHWGLYAIPAGVWKGQPVAGLGEWIMNKARIPVSEYEGLAGQFRATQFDADAWVRLAQDAGMRYIVITSKHHDGFALWGSAVTRYDAVDATPFGRDVLKELSAACARRAMPLGFYYSQSQDWHEPNGAGNTWDFGPDEAKDYDQYLRGKAEPQVRELLAGYGPVALIWFDTPKMMTAERTARFLEIVKAQPDCLVNGRLGAAGDYTSTGDNKIPDGVVAGAWEVPATINDTWGYKTTDENWKSPEDLIFKLVDIVSKGGNYLLNVGPTADGVIPQPSIDRLLRIGAWLKVNGEAIYGTGPTPMGAELLQKDWRCTTKPGRLYFHLFRWPAGRFEASGVSGRVKKAVLLADPARELPARITGTTLTVDLPSAAPDQIASVIRVEVE